MVLPVKTNLRSMLHYVGRPLALMFAFDVAVAVVYVYGGWTRIAMPNVPLTIFGGVIGVILGFRNTSSYQRWWEARKLWGQIVNQSRGLARQVLSFPEAVQEDDNSELRASQRQIILLQIAYVHSLRCQLRGHSPWSELEGVMPDFDWSTARGERNVPLYIQKRIADDLREWYVRGWIDSLRWTALDATLTALLNAQGGVERIKNTPMPKQYDYYPQLFVTVYCILLPLGMVANLRLMTPIGSTLVGFMFLALDQIGRDLEAPFENDEHDVPITSISKTIEINLKQLLGDTELPEPVKPVYGVLW
jgi:ion channel-forming bestrophin family protein